MVEGRGGQFDLAARRQLFMQRNDRAQDGFLLVEQPRLFPLGVAATLCAKFAQLRVLIEDQLVDPGQVAPDLQVAQVAGRKPRHGVLDRIGAEPAPQVKLVIPFVGADHALDVGQEEIVQEIADVGFVHAVRRQARHVQMPVAAALGVGL